MGSFKKINESISPQELLFIGIVFQKETKSASIFKIAQLVNTKNATLAKEVITLCIINAIFVCFPKSPLKMIVSYSNTDKVLI